MINNYNGVYWRSFPPSIIALADKLSLTLNSNLCLADNAWKLRNIASTKDYWQSKPYHELADAIEQHIKEKNYGY